MPKRSLVQRLFNRGLNIVRPPELLDPGQAYKAENVIFTRNSTKRREGSEIAYDADVGVTTVGVIDAIHRYYDLATTGTLQKVLLLTTGSQIYTSNTEWTESTGTAGELAAVLTLPTTGGNTLYDDYSAAPVTIGSGNMKQIYQAKSWAYIPSDYATADDANKVANVPLRLGYINSAYKPFMHGLTPPATLLEADTESLEENVPWNIGLLDEAVTGETFFGQSIAVDSNGGVHIAYLSLPSGGSIYDVKYIFGLPDVQGTVPVWNGTEVVAAATPLAANDISMAVDSKGHPHIVYTNGTSDLVHATKDKDAGTWVITTIDSSSDLREPYVQVSSDDTICVLAHSFTAGERDLRYYFKAPTTASWPSAEIADSVAAVTGVSPSFVIDSSDKIHATYFDVTNTDVRYAIRSSPGTGGTWGTLEQVNQTVAPTSPDTTGAGPSIALTSADVPAIIYLQSTDGQVQFQQRVGGVWTGIDENLGDSATRMPDMGRHLFFDSDDVAVAVIDNEGTDDFRLKYWKRSGGTWGGAPVDSSGVMDSWSAAVIDGDGYFHVIYRNFTTQALKYAVGILRDYHYRLTAEYDDGVLGESGPSAALSVALTDPISAGATHTIALNAGTYNMTDDVTKIHVYRTTKGTTSTSRYYRAGSVDCTNGTPGSTFVDNVEDDDLVDTDVHPLLDEDVFMPPKYKYGAFWRDHAVIAHTKSRDTSDSDQLDTGDTADASIHKNRLRFSRAFTTDVFPQNFFQDILPDGDSGSITGLVVNPTSDRLYVFMENDVVALEELSPLADPKYSLSFTYRNVANAIGTPATKSIVYASGLIFYWTKGGIEVIDGVRGRNITSETIAPLWGATTASASESWYGDRVNMTFINNVAGVYDQKAQRIYWSYVSGTSIEHDKILCLDLKRWSEGGGGDGVFSIWTGVQISAWCRFDGEGDLGEVMGGSGDGTARLTVYRMPFAGGSVSSNADNVRDGAGGDGSDVNAIDVSLHLAPMDGGRPDTLKSWRSMRVSGRGGTASTVTINSVVDGGTPTALGTAFDFSGTTEKRSNSALPRTAIGVRCGLQVETADTITITDGPAPFELYHVSLDYSEKKTRVRPHLAV